MKGGSERLIVRVAFARVDTLRGMGDSFSSNVKH